MTGGRRIGSYEVVRELGRGGMGVVHEVRDPAGRRLALKLILDVAEGEALARFRREAELLARVSHPNVVRVHALDRAPEGPFIVTELVDGQSLQALTRSGPLPPEVAARLARDLADAVGALHARGIVHRDLKPANVIVRPDDTPVLLDFGLARDLVNKERLTVTGTLVGTPVYMAPEQAEGASPSTLGPAVDVYALGALLLEALSGRPPFDSTGGPLATIKHVLLDEPRWPSAVVPGTPHALEAICRVAMSKAPEERYASAAALRDDLDRWLRGEPPLTLGRFPAPRTKGRAAVAAAALGGGAVVVAALALLLATRDDPPPVSPTPVATAPAVDTSTAVVAPRAARPLPELVRAATPGSRVLTLPHGEGHARGLLLPDARALTFGDDHTLVLWALRDPPARLKQLELADTPLAALLIDDHVVVRTWSGVLRVELATLTVRETCTIDPQQTGRFTYNRGLALGSGGLIAPGASIERLDPVSLARLTPLVPFEPPLELHAAVAYGDEVLVAGGTSWNNAGAQGRGQLLAWRGDDPLPPPLREIPPSAVTCLALHEGPRPIVACGMFSGFVLLDILEPSAMRTLGEAPPGEFRQRAHLVDVQDLVFSPDGKLLLSVAHGTVPNEGTLVCELRAWSVEDGSQRWQLEGCGRVVSVDCADVEGRLLLLLGTSTGTVDLWLAPDGGR